MLSIFLGGLISLVVINYDVFLNQLYDVYA